MDADSRAKDSTFRSRARASFSSSTTLAPLQVVSRINFSLCFFFSMTLSRRRTNFQPFRALYMRNMYINTDVVFPITSQSSRCNLYCHVSGG